jgi:exonuclease SbcC
MISSIHIRNFESHVDSALEFSPGLNVIVGLTDAGKSSIFRALQWLVYNKPSGSSMIPLFGETEGWTEVEVEFSDGTKIAKRKKGSQTEYIVGDKRLTGFGRGDVPKDVLDLVQMDDINFQPQIALPFLMFDTAGERSRVLNRVAGLDDIDRALSNADSDSRRIRQTLDSERSLLSSLQSSLDRFADFEKREKTVKEAEALEKDIEETLKVYEQVATLSRQLSEVDAEISEIAWAPRAEILVNAAKKLHKEVSEKVARHESIKRALAALALIEEQIEEIEWAAEKEVQERLKKGLSLLVHIQSTVKKEETLRGALWHIEDLDTQIADAESEISSLSEDLPETCPECGKPL